MTRRLLISYVSLAVLVLVAFSIPLGITLAHLERERLITAIERDSRVLAAEADDMFEAHTFSGLPDLVRSYVRQTGGRVVMVDSSGSSVVDSDHIGDSARDFSSRPEIAAALKGRYSTGERSSQTLGQSLFYVAVPVTHDDTVLGAVRVSYPATQVNRRSRLMWLQLATSGLAVSVLAGLTGWLVASTLGRPIRNLEHASDRLASGALDARVDDSRGPDDLRRVARTFNTMADRVQSFIESQQSFLADASHQLRTPLTALRLRLDRLSTDNPEASADATAASAEVDRLTELVDGLLAMARLDAQSGVPAVVDVAGVVTERVATWEPLAAERDVELVATGTRAPVPAAAVEGGLEQILDNLIANALDVSPPGSTITVDVGTEPARVVVRDEGPGLTDAQIDRAFDRFWRGPGPGGTAATAGGSGLGLAIVQRLAQASGGAATLQRNPTGGLSATVTLPGPQTPGHR